MRLSSSDGASAALRPTGYQFGYELLPRGDWDANWLMVHGEIVTSTGDAWTFHDACLTTWDATELLAWLRAAGQGNVAPIGSSTTEPDGRLSFTEPNLGFSLATNDEQHVVVRVHLSLEAAPNQPDTEADSPRDLYAYSVSLSMTRTDLLIAADEWQSDIANFPER